MRAISPTGSVPSTSTAVSSRRLKGGGAGGASVGDQTPMSSTTDDDELLQMKKKFQDVEERRLREWENYQRSHRSSLEQTAAKAFIDLSIGDVPAGRLVIELFEDIVPQTVENFRTLITGSVPYDTESGMPKLDYLDSSVYRIDKANRYFAMGELQNCSLSSTGQHLPEENFAIRHLHKGTLSMISRGPNKVGSAFSITLDAAPTLDFKQVVFGKVIDGFSVLEKIESIATNRVGTPQQQVTIAFCGALTGAKPPGIFEVASPSRTVKAANASHPQGPSTPASPRGAEDHSSTHTKDHSEVTEVEQNTAYADTINTLSMTTSDDASVCQQEQVAAAA